MNINAISKDTEYNIRPKVQGSREVKLTLPSTRLYTA